MGKNQSLWALGFVSACYSDRQILIQMKILCKCRLRLSGAYVDATHGPTPTRLLASLSLVRSLRETVATSHTNTTEDCSQRAGIPARLPDQHSQNINLRAFASILMRVGAWCADRPSIGVVRAITPQMLHSLPTRLRTAHPFPRLLSFVRLSGFPKGQDASWPFQSSCVLELVCERPQMPVDFSTRTVSQQTHSVCLTADLHQHG